jgi:hypothetical protein
MPVKQLRLVGPISADNGKEELRNSNDTISLKQGVTTPTRLHDKNPMSLVALGMPSEEFACYGGF